MVTKRSVILVAEDDPDLQSLLRHALQGDNVTVHVAGDGQEALERYRELTPDLLVLDVMMPRMSGFEVLRELRETGEMQDRTAVLMLTARAGEDDILRGFDLGVDDYLTKPFVIGELRARVRALLARRR